MRILMKAIKAIAALVLLVGGFFFLPTAGGKAAALGVSPTIVTFNNLAPGEAKEFTIKVYNSKEAPIQAVDCYSLDYARTAEGRLLDLPKEEVNPYYSLSSWITPQMSFPVSLAPYQAVDVPFRLVVPKEVEPGEKWGGIAFVTRGSNQQKEGVSFAEEIVVQVHAFVGGEPVLDLFLEAPKVEKVGGLFSGKYRYTVMVRNRGNVHYLVPEHALFLRIYGPNDRLVREIEFTPTLVLPQVEDLLPGERVFVGEVDFPVRQFASYRFVCELTPLSLVSPPTTIHIIPWWGIFFAVGLILLLLLFVMVFRKRRAKK